MAKMKLPKTAGGWVSLTFKVIGATVVAAPAINVAVLKIQGNGDWSKAPNEILYSYTGFDATNPSGGVNLPQLGVGVASVAGGIFLMKLGTFLGKMVR